MALTKDDELKLPIFNEDEVPSEQTPNYGKNDQWEDPISKEHFV